MHLVRATVRIKRHSPFGSIAVTIPSMQSRSRKLIACVIIGLGGAVAVATVAASWDLIMGQVYLWKLGSEDPEQRESAAERLIELGSVEVAPYLIETFGETFEKSWATFGDAPIMEMLHNRGVESASWPASERWKRNRDKYPDALRIPTILAGIAKKGAATAPYFIDGLENEHAATRAMCAFLVGETGAKSEAVLLALMKSMTDERSFVRTVTVAVVGHMGPRAAPALVGALRDRNGEVRRASAWALKHLGAPAVPHLVATLKSDDEVARIEAARVLGQIGPAASDSVHRLAEILEDEDEVELLRKRAALALGRIGRTGSSTSVSALIRVMTSASPTIRKAAAIALAKIADDVAIAALVKALESDVETRAMAEFSLGHTGPPAVPRLLNALGHEDGSVRAAVVSALGEVGPEPPGIVPAVVRALEDEDESVRRASVSVLERFRRSDDDDVHRAAEEALTRVQGEAPPPRIHRAPSGRRFR